MYARTAKVTIGLFLSLVVTCVQAEPKEPASAVPGKTETLQTKGTPADPSKILSIAGQALVAMHLAFLQRQGMLISPMKGFPFRIRFSEELRNLDNFEYQYQGQKILFESASKADINMEPFGPEVDRANQEARNTGIAQPIYSQKRRITSGYIEFSGSLKMGGKTIRFISGEVSTTKGSKDATFLNGTRAQVDDVSYVYEKGGWRRQ